MEYIPQQINMPKRASRHHAMRSSGLGWFSSAPAAANTPQAARHAASVKHLLFMVFIVC
jgi:hypothetical protein